MDQNTEILLRLEKRLGLVMALLLEMCKPPVAGRLPQVADQARQAYEFLDAQARNTSTTQEKPRGRPKSVDQ